MPMAATMTDRRTRLRGVHADAMRSHHHSANGRFVSLTEIVLELNDQVEHDRDRFDARFEQVDARFDQMDTRFDRVESDLAGVKTDLAGVKTDLAGVKTELADVKDRLTRVEVRTEPIPRMAAQLEMLAGWVMRDELKGQDEHQ